MGAPAWPGNCEKPSLPTWPLKVRCTDLGLSTMSPLCPPLCDRLPDRSERVVERRFSHPLALLVLRSLSSRMVEAEDSA